MTLDTLTRAEIDARLSASSESRVALIRDAAAAGEAAAQAVLGQMLLDGRDLPADPRAAFAWFNAAARQGHAMALNMVGRCYDLGWGVGVDKARASECFRVAAARGLVEAMYNRATALALGEGVAEDKAAALALFEQAAAAGYAKAINHVGSFHEDGWATPRDPAKAADCYARAATGGDFRGAFNHARMQASAGRIDDALAWLERSGASATPAFVAKACAWLAACDRPGASRTRTRCDAPRVLIAIPDVLDAAGVARVRAIIDAAEWIDGNATSGTQSALVKRNTQVPEDAPAAREAGAMVLDALGRAPLFVAAALPLKVFPPLFNRYAGGQDFGVHVDTAIRIRRGSDFRIRSDLSATLFLDDPDSYGGGELAIEDVFGEQRVKLPAGHMVLYPASSLHRVTPVTRGVRTASFFWVQSMVRDDAARRILFDLDRGVQAVATDKGQDDAAVIRLTGVYHNLLRRWADA